MLLCNMVLKSCEDVFHHHQMGQMSDDIWDGWQTLTKRLGGKIQLVGDDLFATNPERVGRGIEMGALGHRRAGCGEVGRRTKGDRRSGKGFAVISQA